MRWLAFVFLVFCIGVILGMSNIVYAAEAVYAAEKPSTSNFVYLFDGTKPDLTEWKDAYDDGTPTDAKIVLGQKDVPPGITMAKIIGTSEKLPFGSVHYDVNIDLDKYPFLEVAVESVDNMWYIIILNEDLKYFEEEEGGGKFIRIQTDTSKTGDFKYDIKKLTGLSGVVTFRLKVGVTTGMSESYNKDKSVSIKFIRFSSI